MIVKVLKRRDVLNLYVVIESFNNHDNYNKWFTYSLVVTEEKIRPDVRGIIEVSKPSDVYVEYEKIRQSIINEYAERDESNEMVTFDNMIKIGEKNIDICKEKLKELNEKHKSIIKKRDEDLKDYNELLEGEIEVTIEQVNFKYFPEHISKKHLLALKPLIKEEE